MKKRIVSFMVTMAMLIALLPALPASANVDIKIGDYIQMGEYYGEPILWRCVDIDENGPLILSDKIICLKPFDAATSANSATGSHSRRSSFGGSLGSNYWADSNMRSWLNSTASAGNVNWLCGNPPADKVYENAYADEAGFLTHFSQGEINAMKSVSQKSLVSYPDIDNNGYTTGSEQHKFNYNIADVVQNYDKAYAEYVTDKMFLMDVKQVNAVYNNRATLGEGYYIGEPTAKAVENSEYKRGSLTTEKKWHCWLRSPNANEDRYMRHVHSNGSVNREFIACSGHGGVRPAFYLNLSSASFTSGSGTEGNPYTIEADATSAATAAPIATLAPQTADTISDEKILDATVLHNNDSFHYYSTFFRSPSVIYNDELRKNDLQKLSKSYLFLDDVLKILTLKTEDGDNLDAVKYYETVLADILENDTNGVWDNVYSTWKTISRTYNNKILQTIVGEVKDIDKIKTSEFLKAYGGETVFDTINDYTNKQEVLKEIKINVDFLDELSFAVDLTGDYFDAEAEVIAYAMVEQEKIDLLKDLQSKTDNPYLKEACGKLIEDIIFAHEKTLIYFAKEWGKETIKDVFEFSHGIVAGLVLQYITTDTAEVTPYIPGIAEAMTIIKAGRFISNGIVKADDISKNILTVMTYASIENEIKKYTKQADSAFEKNNSLKNASTLISYADFMKAAYLQSCDIFKSNLDTLKDSARNQQLAAIISSAFSGDIVDILNRAKNLDGDLNYSDAVKLTESIKGIIKNTDFYSTNGNDISVYMRNVVSTTPSDWAGPFVDKAINYGILPDYMQNNYQNNITRAEFCTLMTYAIEKCTGKSIDELAEKYDYKTTLFKDTHYEFVYYMAQLGIVAGVSADEFQPLGEITREQAATMLMRAAKVLGVDTSASDTNLNGVSDWAKEGVNFVVYNDIMTGTDNGFEPQGTYTKEQAITTMVRFYENL